MDVRVSSSPWVVVRTGNTRGRSMVPEWPRESPGPTFLGSRNIDNFQSLSFAKFRGVQPCAQLTRRADGLGELDPGGIWGDLKWSRATAVDVTPHRVGQNQSRRPIKRTRPRALAHAPHTASTCVYLTYHRLWRIRRCGGSRARRVGPDRNKWYVGFSEKKI